jgi:lipopolysaccharide/colanic/teichoic acid biosynthesis glycosyltransferase
MGIRINALVFLSRDQGRTELLLNPAKPATSTLTHRAALLRYRKFLLRFDLSVIFVLAPVAALCQDWITGAHWSTDFRSLLPIFLLPIVWVSALAGSEAWQLSRLDSPSEPYRRVLAGTSITFAIFASVSYITRTNLSRGYLLAALTLGTLVLLVGRRTVLRAFHNHLQDRDLAPHYLIFAAECQWAELEAASHESFPFATLAGRLDPPIPGDESDWIASLTDRLKNENIDWLIISDRITIELLLFSRLVMTADLLHRLIFIPSPLSGLVERSELLTVNGSAWTQVKLPTIHGSKAVLKRGIDLFAAVVVFPLIALPMLLIGLLVKVTSAGPIFYMDQRVGLDGQLFTFPKFRTMRDGADKERLAHLGRPDESMHERYLKDPRVTRVGGVLRRWSLDELPQWWCVLIGTMSVVGPRPILREELPQILAEDARRQIAKPGLTGLWQVSGRKELAWADRMALDVSYIEQWNIHTDLAIIAKTALTIFRGDGAI